jgi:hypothetical protein
MAASARLSPKSQLALARYCKSRGITKTQALERGIALLLQHDGASAHHPAFEAYQRLQGEFARAPHKPESIRTLKRHLDEKYPASLTSAAYAKSTNDDSRTAPSANRSVRYSAGTGGPK